MIWWILGILLLLIIMIFGTAVLVYKAILIRPKANKVKKSLDPDSDAVKKWQKILAEVDVIKAEFMSFGPEKLTMLSERGETLQAYYLRRPNPDKITIVFSHGYHSYGFQDFALVGKFYLDMGYNILLVDHQAHGDSTGKKIGFGVLDHIELKKWIEIIDEKEHHEQRIFLHGVSMGSNTCLLLADHPLPAAVKGIIGDCGYTSAFDEFAHNLKLQYHLPAFPLLYAMELICKIYAGYGFRRFSTLKTLKNSQYPILLIHGGEDNFVPTYMSRLNYDACTSEKELVIIEGATHALAYRTDPSRYVERVSAFIKKYTK